MADQAQGDKLQVRLVTPERELIDTAADSVELPGRTGYLEVLYGAAPLVTELGTGLVTIHGGGGSDERYYVAWGFAEVLPNRVTILAEKRAKAGGDRRTGGAARVRAWPEDVGPGWRESCTV